MSLLACLLVFQRIVAKITKDIDFGVWMKGRNFGLHTPFSIITSMPIFATIQILWYFIVFESSASQHKKLFSKYPPGS